MQISITLIHNKGDQENINQIEFIKSITSTLQQTINQYNDKGQIIGSFNIPYQVITALQIPHKVKIYQVVPYGVTPPPNRGDINSGGIVYFGKGDEDKVGNHPRFMNWGNKRSLDSGSDILIILYDYKNFNLNDIKNNLNTLNDPSQPLEFISSPSIKVTTSNCWKLFGRIDENKTLATSISDYKNKITSGGKIYG